MACPASSTSWCDGPARASAISASPRPTNDGRTETLSISQRDVGEQWEHAAARRRWAEVCEQLATDPRGRAILLGPAGQGKSFLALMTAREFADRALQQLRAKTAGL